MNLTFAIFAVLAIIFCIRLLWRAVAYRNGTFEASYTERERARKYLSDSGVMLWSSSFGAVSGDVEVFYSCCKKDLHAIAVLAWVAITAKLMAAYGWEGVIAWSLIAFFASFMIVLTLMGMASAIARCDLSAGKIDQDAMSRITRLGVALAIVGLVAWGVLSIRNGSGKVNLVLIFPPQTSRGGELVNAALNQVRPPPKSGRFLIWDGPTTMTWLQAESLLKEIDAKERGNLLSRTFTKGTGTVNDVSFAYIRFN